MATAGPEAIPEWRIEGDWFDLCNFDLGAVRTRS